MKVLGFIAGLLISVSAFAFPQSVTLEGSLKFKRHSTTSSAFAHLTLKKQSATKAKYTGILVYEDVHKRVEENISLEIDLEDNETSGLVSIGLYTRIYGSEISLTSGSQVALSLAVYADGGERCRPKFPNGEVCTKRPDMIIDQGVLTAIVR